MAMLDLLATGLFSYLLHSTALIALAFACERLGLLRRLSTELQETVWRWALFGGLLTAALAVSAELRTPAAEAMPSGPQVQQAAPAAVAVPAQPAIEQVEKAQEPALPSRLFPGTLPLNQAAGPVTALWLLIAGSGLAIMSLQWLWLRRLARRMPASGDAALQAFVARAATRLGLTRTPALRIGQRWASPLVAPGGAICLPLWTAGLSPTQREAVVAHELMHLRRRDPAWRLAGLAFSRLAWLQPLNRLPQQRLDHLAEMACDEGAARLTGNGRALAESLYVCAEQQARQRRRFAPALSAAMSGRQSTLLLRMRSLLENTDMSDETNKTTSASSRRWLLAGGSVLLSLAVLLPVVVVRNADAIGGVRQVLSGIGEMVHTGGNITRIESNGPEGRLRITVHGSVAFNEAEDDVTSVQGLLEISDKRHGHKRELMIKAGDNATQQRSYLRDGVAVTELTTEDRQWLAGVVSLLADATRSPAQRVERLLARGGIDAVFKSIAQQPQDFQRRSLLQALLERGPAETATLDRALQAAAGLSSAFERRSALETIATTQQLSDAQQQAYLKTAASAGSDFEAREALGSLAPRLSSQPEVMNAWVAAVRRIASDFEARTAVEDLLHRDGLSAAQVDAALQASSHIDSDFEHRSALEAIARRIDSSRPSQFQAYADSASRIGSAFERREALLALLSAHPLDKAGYLGVLNAAEKIDSGFELLQVLQAVARKMPADAELIARYRQLSRGLSDHERGQAEKALDRLS